MPSVWMMPSARKAPAGAATRATKSGRRTSAASETRWSRSPSGRHEPVRDAVELVEVVAHRLLEPDRERKEVLVDAVERDRSRLGDLRISGSSWPSEASCFCQAGLEARYSAHARW